MDSTIESLQQMQLVDNGNSFVPVQAIDSAPDSDTDSGSAMQNIVNQLFQMQATAAATAVAPADPVVLTSVAATSSIMLMESSMAAQSSGNVVRARVLAQPLRHTHKLRTATTAPWHSKPCGPTT